MLTRFGMRLRLIDGHIYMTLGCRVFSIHDTLLSNEKKKEIAL